MSETAQQLGKYLIHEELGRGGFGTVYRATDATLDRVVALKILDPLLTRDPGFLERFRREAVGAARLEHPNIVPVYDVGEVEGRSFIAMKYLPGRSLDRLLAEGRLPIERTLHILAQVASALDYAHGKGLIHRDVKPSNILVGPDEASGDPDHATLTDFGLARATDQSIMTSLGQALGTPAYMAPEQLDVDRQTEVGAASDIYSFAVVVYEMLAGRPPFVGPTPAVMAAHLTKEPPPVTQFDADLPPALWEVIKTGLTKDIAGRPQSATWLVAGLMRTIPKERLPSGPIIDALIITQPPKEAVREKLVEPSIGESARPEQSAKKEPGTTSRKWIGYVIALVLSSVVVFAASLLFLIPFGGTLWEIEKILLAVMLLTAESITVWHIAEAPKKRGERTPSDRRGLAILLMGLGVLSAASLFVRTSGLIQVSGIIMAPILFVSGLAYWLKPFRE